MVNVGDYVVDKYKLPKCGDQSKLGKITNVADDGTVTVEMETGIPAERHRVVPAEQFQQLFELENPKE